MNVVVMMGRLTRDPEVRYSASGNAIATFRLAVDRRFKKEGQPNADFFKVVSFGKRAEFVGQYLHKGMKVIVTGSLQNDSYTDHDGNTKSNDQVVANDIEFAEGKQERTPAGDEGLNKLPDIMKELPFE